MTSQPNEQQEPSMEEILSSIRRIIADEATDDDDRDDGEDLDGVRGTLTAGTDRAPDAVVLAEPGYADDDDRGTDEDGAGGGDEDVLELTEVVRESAAVIDLDTAMPSPEPFALRAFKPRAFEPEPGDRDGDQDGRDAGTSGEAEDLADQAAAAADGDASPASTGDEPSVAEPDALSATPWPPAVASGDDHPPFPTTAEIRDHDMAMQTPQNGIDTLVSDQAAGAATGAFAKLSQAVQRTPAELSIADDSGRTTEQFVEDIMRPMLRDWLDENLPTMVERIVQREIQKIVRRAED